MPHYKSHSERVLYKPADQIREMMKSKDDNDTGPTTFPLDESAVVFTDLQGIRRRGVYRKSHGFVEISEMEVPRKEESFFPEEDIVKWEYEPESQSE